MIMLTFLKMYIKYNLTKKEITYICILEII